jgi:hypothetical protein
MWNNESRRETGEGKSLSKEWDDIQKRCKPTADEFFSKTDNYFCLGNGKNGSLVLCCMINV